MNKPPLVIQEQSIIQLMGTLNQVIEYAGSVEETLLQAIRDLSTGEGVEISPVGDATYSAKGVVTLADSTTDIDTHAVSVALLNIVTAQLTNAMGTLTSLETTAKGSLVASINEVRQGRVGLTTAVGSLSSLTTVEKATIVGAINELSNKASTDYSTSIGTLANLTTTAKTNLVLAINEVKTLTDRVGALTGLSTTDKNTVIAAINEVKTKADTVGTVTSLTTSAKTNAVVAINEVVTNMGDLATLTTTAKGTIVSAVNELKSTIGNLTSLNTTVKTSIVAAVNELGTSLGTLASLNTSAKGNVVSAVNEVNTKVGIMSNLTTTAKDSVVSAVNEVNTKVGIMSNLTTTAKDSVASAVNEVNTKVGTMPNLTTTAKGNVVSAVNEVNTKVGTMANLTTTAKGDVVSAINEVKQYANDGKTAIATAVTAKGVTASPADTFTLLATKIEQIPTGGGGLTINGATDVLVRAGTDINAGDLVGSTWDVGDCYQSSEEATAYLSSVIDINQMKFSADSSMAAILHFKDDFFWISMYNYTVATETFAEVHSFSTPADYYEGLELEINSDGSRVMLHHVKDYEKNVYMFSRSGNVYSQVSSILNLNPYTDIILHPTYPVIFAGVWESPCLRVFNYNTGVETWNSGSMLTDAPRLHIHENLTDLYMYDVHSDLKKFTINSTTGVLTEVPTPLPPFSMTNVYRSALAGNLLSLSHDSGEGAPNYCFDIVAGTHEDSQYVYHDICPTSIPNIYTAMYFKPSDGFYQIHVVRHTGNNLETIHIVGGSSSIYSLSKEVLYVQDYNEITKIKGAVLPEVKAFSLGGNTLTDQYDDYLVSAYNYVLGDMALLKRILSK